MHAHTHAHGPWSTRHNMIPPPTVVCVCRTIQYVCKHFRIHIAELIGCDFRWFFGWSGINKRRNLLAQSKKIISFWNRIRFECMVSLCKYLLCFVQVHHFYQRNKQSLCPCTMHTLLRPHRRKQLWFRFFSSFPKSMAANTDNFIAPKTCCFCILNKINNQYLFLSIFCCYSIFNNLHGC